MNKKNALIIETATCDFGSEFINKNVKKWFKENNINVFYVKDDDHRKLSIINRFHRTLKEKILKLFVAEETTRWIDDIDKIIKNYNNTENKGIFNLTPKQASQEFVETYIIAQKRSQTENIELSEQKYEIGQHIRLLKNKKLFDKMQTKYEDKIYTIIKVKKNTLDIEDDTHIIKNVKKDNVKLIETSIKPEIIKGVIKQNKEKVEKEYKQDKLLLRKGMLPENIISTKRGNILNKQLNDYV